MKPVLSLSSDWTAGLGKSTLAMDIARSCAVKHHIPAAFIFLEMGGFCLCLKQTVTCGFGRPQGWITGPSRHRCLASRPGGWRPARPAQLPTFHRQSAALVGCLDAEAETDAPPHVGCRVGRAVPGRLPGTAGLNASSAPDLQPEKHVSAECRELIADIETQLDKARPEAGNDGILAFSRQRPSAEDCKDELRDFFRKDR